MQTRIIRPDLKQPGEYQILLGDSMLTWLEDGLLGQVQTLRADIANHDDCNLKDVGGCHWRHDWALKEYGDIQNAMANGYRQTDCSEDLMFLHGELSRLMDFLTQSRFIRTRPDARSYHEVSDAEARLLAIKGQAAHMEAQASVPTGHMLKLTDEELARLDAEAEGERIQARKANGESLLDLDATSGMAAAASAKPPVGKIKVVAK